MHKIAKYKKELVWKKTNGRCFYCNRPGEHLDHFMPKKIIKEFPYPFNQNLDEVENLFFACERCNVKKGVKFPEDFMGNWYVCWDRHDRANLRIGIKPICST